MTSLGHRTGLWDALAELDPATSHEIAQAAGLQERYVREWLGAMVAGGIVEYDPATATYHLPAEHAACLTRAASPNNIAATAQWLPVLAGVEDHIVERFTAGGGVSYQCYHRFHQVMAEESGQTVVAGLFEHILPLAPGLIERLAAGIDVLDVGCGSGRAIVRMAAEFPRSRFAGIDFSEEGIAAANAAARDAGVTNARFHVRDAAQINQPAAYDLITAFDAIHDQIAPAQVLDEIAAALRPDGLFLMQDIGASSHVEKNKAHPLGPFLYTVSCMHCMTVSLAGGGAGLGAVWGEELAQRMLRDAGFARVEVKRLPHDIINNYYLARKGPEPTFGP
jgi:2-polyprenyl-3-methyl-5-hydroxy-6-metoxy-1,4-benzoquinol methylase